MGRSINTPSEGAFFKKNVTNASKRGLDARADRLGEILRPMSRIHGTPDALKRMITLQERGKRPKRISDAKSVCGM